MKRLLLSVLVLAAVGLPLRAHFIWLLPPAPEADKPVVRAVFSDQLAPDDPKFLDKIKQTEWFLVAPEKKPAALKMTLGKDAWEAPVELKGVQAVVGRCDYGVLTRGDATFGLRYYAKTIMLPAKAEPADLKAAGSLTSDVMTLDILVGSDGIKVLWQGKPLADAEVVVIGDEEGKSVERKSDKNGEVKLTKEDAEAAGFKKMGGVRVKYVEAKEGEVDGKKFKEIRHYATVTLRGHGKAEVKPPEQVKKDAKDEVQKEDPAASRLLAEARGARAQYVNFPGFTAQIEINLDGKVHKGKVEVANTGKVTVDTTDPDAAKWAAGVLGQTVGHRLDDSARLKTACVFADEDDRHPLGRAIQVIDDEFHSSYRVRDQQIIVVNRTQGDVRFTITVMHNDRTEEGKFIPETFTVNTWDLKSDVLKSSQTHHHTWKRVGKFDLPETITVVTATNGKLEARGLKLSDVSLTK